MKAKEPYNIPNIFNSLKADYAAGIISIEKVAEELCKANFKNFIDIDYAKKIMNETK